MLTSVKERSTLWDSVEFGGCLSTSEALFAHCPSCIDYMIVVTLMYFNFKE
jgi:hypothetical protein